MERKQKKREKKSFLNSAHYWTRMQLAHKANQTKVYVCWEKPQNSVHKTRAETEEKKETNTKKRYSQPAVKVGSRYNTQNNHQQQQKQKRYRERVKQLKRLSSINKQAAYVSFLPFFALHVSRKKRKINIK